MTILKFGVRLPVSGPFANANSIIGATLSAERLGFDFVTVHDHITRGFEERYHFAVGTVEAVDSAVEVSNFYESVATLSFLAGLTKRLIFIPAALVLPVRNAPVVLKQFQTAQDLSGGRFIFCAAVGNAEKDFEVTETSWEERGKKMDEDLELVRKIMTSSRKPISFDGKYTKFQNAEFSPQVSLPIWIAGKGPAALRRTAMYGNGWMPSGVTPEVLDETREKLVKQLEKNGRSLSEIEICVEIFVGIAKSSKEAKEQFGPTFSKFSNLPDIVRIGSYTKVPIGDPSEISEWVTKYERAGATSFEAKFYAKDLNQLLESMELFADKVMPKFGKSTAVVGAR